MTKAKRPHCHTVHWAESSVVKPYQLTNLLAVMSMKCKGLEMQAASIEIWTQLCRKAITVKSKDFYIIHTRIIATWSPVLILSYFDTTFPLTWGYNLVKYSSYHTLSKLQCPNHFPIFLLRSLSSPPLPLCMQVSLLLLLMSNASHQLKSLLN